jgi:heme/copper-type cytochrome/quinol oxidase subunit 1
MGAVFAIFGGFYHWLGVITGYCYSEWLGRLQFYTMFAGVNCTFFPHHWLGLAGMPRRIPCYPESFHVLNTISTHGSYCTLLSLIIFGIHLITIFTKKKEFQYYTKANHQGVEFKYNTLTNNQEVVVKSSNKKVLCMEWYENMHCY